MMPAPGETPRGTGEAVGRVVEGTVEVVVEVEELEGDEAVVVLGLVEDTVVEDTVVEDTVVEDTVVEDTVVEDTAVARVVDPSVVVVWLVESAGEVFGVAEVGSD